MQFDIRNEYDELFCKADIDKNGSTTLTTKEGYRYKEISLDEINRQVEEAKNKAS